MKVLENFSAMNFDMCCNSKKETGRRKFYLKHEQRKSSMRINLFFPSSYDELHHKMLTLDIYE